jgi:hypothetical protein
MPEKTLRQIYKVASRVTSYRYSVMLSPGPKAAGGDKPAATKPKTPVKRGGGSTSKRGG